MRSAAATLLKVVEGVKTETLADMKANLITNLGKVVNHPQVITATSAKLVTMPTTPPAAKNGNHAAAA